MEECTQCDALVGERHKTFCPTARCKAHGYQLIGCWDSNIYCAPTVWTGVWPGKVECQEFDWYADEDSIWGRTEDLNRLAAAAHTGEVVWSPRDERYYLSVDTD